LTDHEKTGRRIPVAIAAGVVALLAIGGALFARAAGGTNKIALAATPKGVTALRAAAAKYRRTRRYVGTLEPWVSARIGPQLVSAYIDTVLVRPGAVVKRGQVVATLDCRNSAAINKAVSMQARALERTQKAVASESARVGSLLGGGFVSPDEVEQKQAESESKQAQVLGLQAQMLEASLQVSDCVLRAPFDGEIAERSMDPGAFVRPGSSIVTEIDRDAIRLVADVPEDDFADVAPGALVAIHVLATNQDLTGKVARRAPGADPSTRTIHVEVDLLNRDRSIPVNTTAQLRLDVGRPVEAAQIPLAAATVRGEKATVFVIEDDVARQKTFHMLGEREGALFLDPQLKPGTPVVTQGRTALSEGDKVQAQIHDPASPAPAEGRIAGEARP
jgi:RND family efflux transporter MFP subunit